MTATLIGILGQIGMETAHRPEDEWDEKPALAVVPVALTTLLLDQLKDHLPILVESALADRMWNEPAQAEKM